MDETDEEALMVAGFARGLGLSGNGCGALGAAIWKTTLELVKKGEWKYTLFNPTFDKIIKNSIKNPITILNAVKYVLINIIQSKSIPNT